MEYLALSLSLNCDQHDGNERPTRLDPRCLRNRNPFARYRDSKPKGAGQAKPSVELWLRQQESLFDELPNGAEIAVQDRCDAFGAK